jgi:hypothetical protein
MLARLGGFRIFSAPSMLAFTCLLEILMVTFTRCTVRKLRVSVDLISEFEL